MVTRVLFVFFTALAYSSALLFNPPKAVRPSWQGKSVVRKLGKAAARMYDRDNLGVALASASFPKPFKARPRIPAPRRGFGPAFRAISHSYEIEEATTLSALPRRITLPAAPSLRPFMKGISKIVVDMYEKGI
eukprot:CAMPEP_0172614464 /NCGR_PEP_ID=MMETSP1068-20121228/51463_1 /TAXON_ID=35684 /ORGANISM="Pseudopedinella elastica, Strain CCMP716" /LENGTH=132 /DNA_ID=CAMNT_0013419271 /DNA_START=89 /DNA_END=487 /DNA_ORIENTATION=+